MILIKFDKNEKIDFERIVDRAILEEGYIESKKLDGNEVFLQVAITTVSIAVPYIVEFFRSMKKKEKEIKIISKGVQMVFETEDDLKEFLSKIPDSKND